MQSDFVEGWTQRILVKLGVDLTRADSVSLELCPKGSPIPLALSAAQCGIADAARSTVFYDPAVGDLVAARSPYSVRWKLTQNGVATYYPVSFTMSWVVRKP